MTTRAAMPSRLLFTSTVRAAAIGSGTAPGPVLVADVGAQLTEVAVLANGGLAAARRADIGLRDLIGATAIDALVHTIAELVDEATPRPTLPRRCDGCPPWPRPGRRRRD